MCKIFAMTNVSQVKVTNDFLNKVKDAVCKVTDKDGFGYAFNTVDGQIWGERTTEPNKFEPLGKVINSKTNQLPIVRKTMNQFGPIGHDDNASFIAHGRFSTNTVNLDNTHPFMNDSIALIHNGVVYDPLKAVQDLKTDCDSEILLKLWEQNGINSIEKYASGYYAIALLDKLGQLHIVRDDRASLYMTYSPTVDSYLIATTTDILKEIAGRMGWVIEKCEPIMDNVYVIFKGNDIGFHRSIEPLEYYNDNLDQDKVDRALGYNVEYLSGDYAAYKEEHEAFNDECIDDLNNDDAPMDDDRVEEVVNRIIARRG